MHSHLGIMNLFLPGSAHAVERIQEHLAWDLNKWAILLVIFGSIGFMRTYALQLSSWMDEYFSE